MIPLYPLFCRVDQSDKGVKAEFEKVNSIVQESIKLGLQWDVTVLDTNQKIEYVRPETNPHT